MLFEMSRIAFHHGADGDDAGPVMCTLVHERVV